MKLRTRILSIVMAGTLTFSIASSSFVTASALDSTSVKAAYVAKNIATDVAGATLSAMGLGPLGSVAATGALSLVSNLVGFGIDSADEEPSNSDIMNRLDEVEEKLGTKIDEATAKILQEYRESTYQIMQQNRQNTNIILGLVNDLSSQVEKFHKEDQNALKRIESHLDTQDFKKQCDIVMQDYRHALKTVNNFTKDKTVSDDGKNIDENTYNIYSDILNDSECNISTLKKDLEDMASMVSGESYVTDGRSAYILYLDSLYNNLVPENVPRTENGIHDVKVDFRGDLQGIQAHCNFDFVTIAMLTDMDYKCLCYEHENGLPPRYKSFDETTLKNMMDDLNTTMDTITENYNDAMKYIDDMTITQVLTPNDAELYKDFGAAWTDAYRKSLDGTEVQVVLNGKYIANGEYGFAGSKSAATAENGFTENGGLVVPDNSSIKLYGVVNMPTLDMSAQPDGEIFSLAHPSADGDTINLSLDNVKLTGGKSGIVFHSIMGDIQSTFHDSIVLNDCVLTGFTGNGINWDCQGYYRTAMARKYLNLELTGTTVSNCAGAAINLTTESSPATLKVDKCDITGNGCGITQNQIKGIDPSFSAQCGLSADIKDSSFTDNKGSALSFDLLIKDNYHGASSITNCVFSGNSTAKNGGAICFNGKFGSVITLNISESTFTNNTAAGQGNAIYASGTAPKLVLTGCTIDSSDIAGNVTINP